MKIALTCFSTVDAERKSDCSMPAFVLPCGHLAQHLELARRQRRERARRPRAAAAHERVDDLRIDDRTACAHLAQGVHEVLEVADAVLQQVAEPGRAVGEQRERVALVGVLREHDDARVGVRGADRAGGLDALHVVARRHPDVGEHRVGREPPHRVEQLGRVAGARDHVDLAGVLEQSAHALAHEVVVLGDDDPQRARLIQRAPPRARDGASVHGQVHEHRRARWLVRRHPHRAAQRRHPVADVREAAAGRGAGSSVGADAASVVGDRDPQVPVARARARPTRASRCACFAVFASASRTT